MKAVIVALAIVALACAPAPHAGDVIAIVEESAVIVWDPATTTEHFIRRATFRGQGRDFGFLVPTPNVPTLAEVDDGIFEKLERRTQREIVYVRQNEIDWTPIVVMMFGRKTTMVTTARPPVEVLSTQPRAPRP